MTIQILRGQPIGTIYSLTDPLTRTVFYIGRTFCSLEDRLQLHIIDAKKEKSEKDKFINLLLQQSIKPIIEPIETVVGSIKEISPHLNKLERKWAIHFNEQNPLLNVFFCKKPTKPISPESPAQIKVPLEQNRIRKAPAYIMSCILCNSKFPATRSDAQLCSAKCRQQFKRKGSKLRRQTEPSKSMPPALQVKIAENNKPANKAGILKERNFLIPIKTENPFGRDEVTYEEFHENIAGQHKKAEIPYPKDWDSLGRLAKMKWLTANR